MSAPELGGLPMLVFVAWRNVWRNPMRSVLTISALASGLAMVILYAAMLAGMSRQMVQFATEVSTGHLQVHRRAFIEDRDLYATLPWAYLAEMERSFPGLRFAPRLYAAGLASAGEASTGVFIEGVDPGREPLVTRLLGHVREGALDLGIADTTQEGITRYNAAIGAQLARNLDVGPGSELVLVTQAADGSIGNALFRVAAVLRPLEPNFDRTGVLMSVEAYQELIYLSDGFHELAVATPDIARIDGELSALAQELERLAAAQPLDAPGGPAVPRNWRQLSPAVADMVALSRTMFLFVGSIIAGLASLGMLNTMLMAVYERTREFGILLAIGMNRRWLILMVLFESLFLALVSAASGSALGVLAGRYFQERGIDFSGSLPDGFDFAGIVFEPVMRGYVEPIQVLYACILMVAVAMLAAVIPSWRTARLAPAEAMR